MDQEQILKKLLETNQTLVKEIKGLRLDLIEDISDACSPEVALSILGLKNRRLLTYFAEGAQLITRQEGGGSFIYYKEELKLLSKKIKLGEVKVPKIAHIPKMKKK